MIHHPHIFPALTRQEYDPAGSHAKKADSAAPQRQERSQRQES